MRNFQLTLLLISCLCIPHSFAAIPSQTPLERNAYQKLPSSQEINTFLGELVQNSSNSSLVNLGKSAGGRDISAILISKDPEFLATGKSSKDKLTVLMIGSQHGGEASGCEGLQKLALSFSTNQHNSFLDNMNLMLVVNGNPDGRDLSSRFNAINGNINIDFIKQTYPETHIYTDILNKYQPDAILDLHESSTKKKVLTLEQGYTTDVDAQYEIGNNPNIYPDLLNYSNKVLLPELIAITNQKGLKGSHYNGEIQTLNQPVAHGGLHASNLRNYSALHGSLSFLVENRLDTPDQKYPTPGNIKERQEKQYLSALSFLTLLEKHKETVLHKVRTARQAWKNSLDSQPQIKMLAKYNLDTQKPCVPIHLKDAKTQASVVRKFANYDFVDIKNSLPLPDAYVVSQSQKVIADVLQKHHIEFKVIDMPETVLAMPLKITDIHVNQPKNEKYQSSVEVEANYFLSKRTLHKGDLLVKMQQPLGRLAVLLLDPRSMDSIYQDLRFRSLLVKNTPLSIYPIKYHFSV